MHLWLMITMMITMMTDHENLSYSRVGDFYPSFITVDDAKQYPLPSQQETLNSLPIMPNYIRNPEFPYSTKKDPLPMMNSGPPPNHIVTHGTSLNQKQSGVHKGPGVGAPGVGPSGPAQTARPILVQVPSSQGNRSNSSSPQLPSSTNNMSKQNCSTERMDMETDTRQGRSAVLSENFFLYNIYFCRLFIDLCRSYFIQRLYCRVISYHVPYLTMK